MGHKRRAEGLSVHRDLEDPVNSVIYLFILAAA